LHDSIGWQFRDRRQFTVGFHGAEVFQLFLPFADDISKHGLKFLEESEWFQLHHVIQIVGHSRDRSILMDGAHGLRLLAFDRIDDRKANALRSNTLRV
jgi:hypothetical protein